MTSRKPDEDTRRFAQGLLFNWLVCGTDGHARNHSLLLSGGDVRLAPLYDLNSHLAYSDGSGNDLSMGVDGRYRASGISIDHWIGAAPRLHVEPDWIRDEIRRLSDGLVDAMTRAAGSGDIAVYDSPAVTRLLANTEAWIPKLA